jgi:hypothetical protein
LAGRDVITVTSLGQVKVAWRSKWTKAGRVIGGQVRTCGGGAAAEAAGSVDGSTKLGEEAGGKQAPTPREGTGLLLGSSGR